MQSPGAGWADDACMRASVPTGTGWRGTRCSRAGLGLIECLLATLVLTVAVLGLALAIGAGRQQVTYAVEEHHATSLAEQLLEEIVARPYAGNGTARSDWCLDDYDGFAEAPGGLMDAQGELLNDEYQGFARACSVTPGSITLAGLSSGPIPGKNVVVTITGLTGAEWDFERFIPEPSEP